MGDVTVAGGSDISMVPAGEQEMRGLIHMVRGVQVMFDSDLARLYQVETKRINEAVRRNKARFPEEFLLPPF